MTLGLVWSLIQHRNLQMNKTGTGSGVTAKEGLLSWCTECASVLPGLAIDNFTTSWYDGLAFLALLAKQRPELVDFSKHTKETQRNNLECAFALGEKEFGIVPLLDVEDFFEATVTIDERSMMTYISEFFVAFSSSKAEQSLPVSAPTQANAEELEKRTDQLAELQQALENAQKEITELRQKLQSSQGSAEVQNVLDNCQEDLKQLREKELALQTTNAELQHKLSQRETNDSGELAKLQGMLAEHERKAGEQNDQLNREQEKSRDLNILLQQCELQLEQKKGEAAARNAREVAANAKLTAAKSEISTLNQIIAERNKQLVGQQHEHELDGKNVITKLREDLSTKAALLERADAALAAQAAQAKERESTIAAHVVKCNEQISLLAQEKRELADKTLEAQQQLADLQAKFEKKQSAEGEELRQKDEIVAALRAEIARMSAVKAEELATKDQKIALLQASVTRLESDVESHMRDFASSVGGFSSETASEALKREQEVVEELSRTRAEMRRQTEANETELALLRAEVASLRANEVPLRDEVSSLRAEVERREADNKKWAEHGSMSESTIASLKMHIAQMEKEREKDKAREEVVCPRCRSVQQTIDEVSASLEQHNAQWQERLSALSERVEHSGQRIAVMQHETLTKTATLESDLHGALMELHVTRSRLERRLAASSTSTSTTTTAMSTTSTASLTSTSTSTSMMTTTTSATEVAAALGATSQSEIRDTIARVTAEADALNADLVSREQRNTADMQLVTTKLAQLKALRSLLHMEPLSPPHSPQAQPSPPPVQQIASADVAYEVPTSEGSYGSDGGCADAAGSSLTRPMSPSRIPRPKMTPSKDSLQKRAPETRRSVDTKKAASPTTTTAVRRYSAASKLPSAKIEHTAKSIPHTRLPYAFDSFKPHTSDCRDPRLRKKFDALLAKTNASGVVGCLNVSAASTDDVANAAPNSAAEVTPVVLQDFLLAEYSTSVTLQQARRLLLLMNPKQGLVQWAQFYSVLYEYVSTHKSNARHGPAAAATTRPAARPSSSPRTQQAAATTASPRSIRK
eukprot:TRINITY_DN6920_c0_g1_i1.p1 TRINITY_DN6920_c0_g1~~TRINITY_DN6920_c0_g1_i1.p1  ORF type:complete len:1163 (+),score=299.23 TRINITY_DN6920_c0_g1_i1:357-3491(+)